MNRKKIVNRLFFIAVSFFIAIILLDVAKVFKHTVTASEYIHDIFAMTGSVLLLITFIQWVQNISIINKIKYIFYSIILFFGINYFYPFYFKENSSTNIAIFISIASVISLTLLMLVLALIRELVLVQRRKGTNRNFNLLFLSL